MFVAQLSEAAMVNQKLESLHIAFGIAKKVSILFPVLLELFFILFFFF